MKKNIIAIVLFLLFLFSTSGQASALNYFEKIAENPSIEDSIKITLEGKEKGELDSIDYVFLYYLLKAQGEREKAIFAALEGFEKCEDETVSTILVDIIMNEFAYNGFTEKISTEMLKKKKDDFRDPLLRTAISNILFIEYSRKGDKASADEILDKAGIPQGFFYSILTEENARLSFLNSDYSAVNHSNMAYSQRDGFMLHIPSSMVNTTSDFLALKSIPFEVAENEEIEMAIITNSPFKIYIDGKLTFIKNSFDNILPPKDVINFKAKKGCHLIDIIYYSVNSGDGLTMTLWEKGNNQNGFKYLDQIKEANEDQKITEIERKNVFSRQTEDSFLNKIVWALYKASLGDYPSSRLDFEKLLEEHSENILLKILYTNLIIEKSYDLPQLYAVSKGEKTVESILKENPNCPEALFYNTLLKSSSTQKEEVLSELRSICEKFSNDPRWFVQLAQELEAVDFISEAKDVLLKAEEIFPGNSMVEEEIFNFYKNRGDFEKSLQYLDKISKRRNVYSEYEKYYSEKGEYGKAIDYLLKEKEVYGDFDFFFEKNLVYHLLKLGKYEEALKTTQILLEANPNSEQFQVLKAKILFRLEKKEEALEIFEKIKEKSPKYFDYDYAKWLMTGKLPFEEERISYQEAMKNYDGKADGASSSYVLDHQISLIQKDGSTIERYHGIVKIHDKDGVEREGEVQFPADYLVLLRTIKQDGRIIEPEYVSSKRTIGMTGLEVGDIIEYEYFNLSPPNNIKKGSYYTPYVFLFQDIEKPFFHTSWTVKYPKDFKMDFYEQNLPDKPKVYENDGLLIRKYDYNAMPRIAYEPSAPFKNYYLPLVDITGNITWDDYYNYLKNQFVGSFAVGVEIEKKAKALTEGLRSEEDKVNAIVNFVFDEIEGEGERWSDPTETLLSGQGNRLQLALALLKSAKIDFEFVVAETNSLKYDNNPLPTQGRFTVPLIKINSKNPYFIYLEDAYRNVRILPSYLQGSRYISLKEDKFVAKKLPEDYSPYLNCLQKEKRVIDRDGNLKVNLNQILDPDQSSDLRSILKRVEKDRWKEVLQMAFSKQFGNAEIGDYEFQNIDDIQKNLGLSTEIYVSSFGTKTDKGLRIDNIYERVELSKFLAQLTKRELPLSVSQPIILNQEFQIVLPSGKISSFEKKKKKIESKFGKYFLEVKPKKGEIFIKRFLYIYEQEVTKEEYPQFANFLKEIDNCETTSVEVELVK